MADANDILESYIDSMNKYGGDYAFFNPHNVPNLRDSFEIDSDDESHRSDTKEGGNLKYHDYERDDADIDDGDYTPLENNTNDQADIYTKIYFDCKESKKNGGYNENIYVNISSLKIDDSSEEKKEVIKNHKKGANDKKYTLSSDQLISIVDQLKF